MSEQTNALTWVLHLCADASGELQSIEDDFQDEQLKIVRSTLREVEALSDYLLEIGTPFDPHRAKVPELARGYEVRTLASAIENIRYYRELDCEPETRAILDRTFRAVAKVVALLGMDGFCYDPPAVGCQFKKRP